MVLSSAPTDERGWLELRGIIHAHSVYSHDACDDKPRDDAGAINEPCFQDVRHGICATGHDFVMLTDHGDSFADTEYPEVLLYRADQGDALVKRDGEPVANELGCPDGHHALVMAGTETGTMPVGLERHVGDTPEERHSAYSSVTPEAIASFKAAGAVALVQHTEDWTVDELAELPLDGFEMYNLHANTYLAVGEIMALLSKLNSNPEGLPHPDLAFLPIIREDPVYLDLWGSVLARGARRVTTLASDSHQNTAWQMLEDGERIDSFRRIMQLFSNHLLVRPEPDGSWNDRSVKEALRAGRLFGVFEHLGYASGFDFHATQTGQVREMGEEASISAGATLQVSMPAVRELSVRAKQPSLVIRVLRAREGGWDEAVTGTDDVSFAPTEPGAYRAEVRMTPRHLAPYLGDYEELASQEVVWIYSNAIYVVP